jgi:hypothetical protein
MQLESRATRREVTRALNIVISIVKYTIKPLPTVKNKALMLVGM